MTAIQTLPAVAAFAFAFAGPAMGQAPEAATMLDTSEDLEWTEIVPGISFAPVVGDYTREAYVKMVKFDPGVESPPHTHTHPYHGIVIQGTVTNPYRGEADPPRMAPGTYWYVPGGAEHVTACVSEEPCLFYTHGDELWDLNVVEWPAAESEGSGSR